MRLEHSFKVAGIDAGVPPAAAARWPASANGVVQRGEAVGDVEGQQSGSSPAGPVPRRAVAQAPFVPGLRDAHQQELRGGSPTCSASGAAPQLVSSCVDLAAGMLFRIVTAQWLDAFMCVQAVQHVMTCVMHIRHPPYNVRQFLWSL